MMIARSNTFIALAIFISFTFLYWYSTSPLPSGYADSDELLTTSFLGGVAHPPGFALLTSLTYVTMKLLSGTTPSAVGNHLVNVMQAGALGILFLVMVKVLPITHWKEQRSGVLAALCATALLGLSYLWWLYATRFEIFPFNHVLVAFTLLWAIWWYGSKINYGHWWWLTWLTAGVAMGHYPLVILLFPGLLVLLLAKFIRLHVSWKQVLGHSLLGMTILIFGFFISNVPLYFQMQKEAVVSWYVPQTAQGWLFHILRKDLGGYSYERGVTFDAYNLGFELINAQAIKAFTGYFAILIDHLGMIMILLGSIGVCFLWKRNRAVGLAFVLMWFLSGPVLNAYMGASPPTFQPAFFNGIAQRQLLMSQMLFAVLVAGGFAWLFGWFWHKRWGNMLIFGSMVLVIGGQLWLNQALLFQQKDREVVAAYAQRVLELADENAIIICTSDVDCYSLLYATIVANVRPDVTVMPYTPTYRRWYIAQNTELYPFGDLEEPDFLPRLIRHNIAKRPVYLTNGLNFYTDYVGWEKGPYFLRPEGLLFRVGTEMPQPEFLAEPFVQTIAHLPVDRRDGYFQGLREVMGNMRAYAGYLAILYGEKDTAKGFLTEAVALDPNSQAKELLADLDRYAQELRIE